MKTLFRLTPEEMKRFAKKNDVVHETQKDDPAVSEPAVKKTAVKREYTAASVANDEKTLVRSTTAELAPKGELLFSTKPSNKINVFLIVMGVVLVMFYLVPLILCVVGFVGMRKYKKDLSAFMNTE